MTSEYTIRSLEEDDLDLVAALAACVWEPSKLDENRLHFARHLARPETGTVQVALVGGRLVAFADCCLRHDYVEGCETSPVAYLEGIYVEAKWRGQGIAAALVRACEGWARELGCLEFASDADIRNHSSQAFHRALGFTEAARIVHFHKRLNPGT